MPTLLLSLHLDEFAVARRARWLGPVANPTDRAVFVVSGNLLADDGETWAPPPDVPDGSEVVAWSGGLGDALMDPHPMTWLGGPGGGWRVLDAACARLAPLLARRSLRLILRTHARHVLGDMQAAMKFCGGHDPVRFGVLPDVPAMFTRGMLARWEDHLDRMVGVIRALGAGAGAIPLGAVLGEVDAGEWAAGGTPDDIDDGAPVQRAGPGDSKPGPGRAGWAERLKPLESELSVICVDGSAEPGGVGV